VRRVRRRTLLAWAIGGTLAALTASVAAVLAVFVQPGGPPQQRIRLGRPLSELRDGEAVVITSASGSPFVMADGAGYNRPGDTATTAYVVRWCGKVGVLAATCSHLGCTASFDASRQLFVCPCHGSGYAPACGTGKSEFAVDGSVLHGPARYALAHLRWRAGATPDEILVDDPVNSPR
jgi:Rieske Fe-S protein